MNTHASRCCGLIAAALTILACADSTPRAGDNAVRDSAGVTIVESVSPEWTNETAWLVDTTAPLVYGEGEPVERQPLDPASVFRTAAGEVVVADGNQSGWHNLLVYDANGRWLRTLGRQGQGPCEFSQVWWAAPYRGDSIAV